LLLELSIRRNILNLECAKTRKYPKPDPKISGFLRSDLRNLKFYEVKPGPTPTRIFGLGVFLGFLGFQVMLHTLPTHSEV
jgi:hypothetical protein